MNDREKGRELKHENDLFFVCSVIEYIGRETKNLRSSVVETLGGEEISRLYELADVLHCEPIEYTAANLIDKYHIEIGSFDNLANCKYNIPTHFDIAKVYKRLICAVSADRKNTVVEALAEVYKSWICEKIDDYNSSMYFENPQYLYASYTAGKVLD
jgi:hypothetical protein